MNIKFPVLVFNNQDKMFYIFQSEKIFETTSNEGLRRGVFNNLTVVDSEGIVYETMGAEKVGWAAPLWGYFSLRKGRQIKVCVKFKSSQEKISLPYLKEKVLKEMYASKGMIKQAYFEKMSLEEYKEAIENCLSYQDLYSILQ